MSDEIYLKKDGKKYAIENNCRYQIYDLNNNLLVDDIITSSKSRLQLNPLEGEGFLISFDDKHYINLNSKKIIYKEIANSKDFNKVKFDINNFSGYKMDSWHKICFDKEPIDDTVDIYRENDINEVDKEVKGLVEIINELPYCKTISSCSGHGIKYLYVTIVVDNILPLKILSKIIFDNFDGEVSLVTVEKMPQRGIDIGVILNISVSSTGEKAYKIANELKEQIENYLANDLKSYLNSDQPSFCNNEEINLKKDENKSLIENTSHYQIFDLNNNLLLDDIITDCKIRAQMNPKNGEGVLISFDNKHYFNLKNKELIYKKINDGGEFNRVEFDINDFSRYKMDSWHKICFDKELIDDTVVIYRENNIYELDPEVKDLVETLNKLPYCRTISSCSGHDKTPLFVTCKVDNLIPIEILSKIIYDNYNKIFYIDTISGTAQFGFGKGFSFTIKTNDIMGKKAYALAKDLSFRISQYIKNDLYSDLYNEKTIALGNNETDILEKEINSLKNTFNKMRGVTVNNDIIEYRKIGLIFYSKEIIDEVLDVLWSDFKEDFVVSTDKRVPYLKKEQEYTGINLILQFTMEDKEIVTKIHELNEALIKKITIWDARKS